MSSLRLLLVAAGLAAAVVVTAAGDKPVAWSQWGGPDQDFNAPASGLASNWPVDGPQELWSRKLGDGYSAIVVDGDRLYTMYRAGDEEAVICLDAGTGETVWEHRYEHSPHERHVKVFGTGPQATPLIAGNLLFTVGIAGKMHALSKNDGEVRWSHDLWGEDLLGNRLIHGYGSSPAAYEDTVIVPVGGENAGLVAFDQKTGAVKWRTQGFTNSYSSPRIVEILGEPQLVVFMAEELIGVNPANGELRWRYPHTNEWKHNITTPMVVGGDTVFLSSPQTGARGLRLTRNDKTMEVEEIWSTRRVQFYHTTTPQTGDWVYGSSGVSLAFMTAVNIRTGDVAWKERGIARANCVAADGKLVILDEEGVLYLATATPESLTIHAQTQLFSNVAWTVPTIVGTTLYARDKTRILALNLG